ncbi:MAG: hypothetical protein AAF721_25655 [Myxococcota bacterium]
MNAPLPGFELANGDTDDRFNGERFALVVPLEETDLFGLHVVQQLGGLCREHELEPPASRARCDLAQQLDELGDQI